MTCLPELNAPKTGVMQAYNGNTHFNLNHLYMSLCHPWPKAVIGEQADLLAKKQELLYSCITWPLPVLLNIYLCIGVNYIKIKKPNLVLLIMFIFKHRRTQKMCTIYYFHVITPITFTYGMHFKDSRTVTNLFIL